MSVLGVVMAGGRNTRYGDHKALAPVGGTRILERVRRALAAVTPDVVLVANEPEVYADTGLEQRPDARPGTGVLGGILTALLWARERGHAGALVVACDMPFVPPGLLAELAARAGAGAAGERPGPTGALAGGEASRSVGSAGASGPPDIVAAESGGRRGIEPLCAYYATECLDAVERALDRGDRRVISFFEELRVARVPLDEVRRFGDPEVLFMNVNTPAERERAERIAAAPAPGPGSGRGSPTEERS